MQNVTVIHLPYMSVSYSFLLKLYVDKIQSMNKMRCSNAMYFLLRDNEAGNIYTLCTGITVSQDW